MKRSWEALGNAPSMPFEFMGKSPTVLVEYDGPQLVLYGTEFGDRLGVLADSNSTHERWVLASASKLELEALARGGLPMRDIFSRKEALQVVDFSTPRKADATWRIDSARVPFGVLPAKGAPLPSASRMALLKRLKARAVTGRRLRFGGAPVSESTIELSGLAQLSQWFQKLWTAIGDSLGMNTPAFHRGPAQTGLIAYATSRGSFAINLAANDETAFDQVLNRYRVLIGAAYESAAALDGELFKHKELRATFSGYFGMLEKLRAEVLVETPHAQVYVGHARAKGIRVALKPAAIKPEATEDEPTLIERRGYFDEFGVGQRTFMFVDFDSEDTFKGAVAPALSEKVELGSTKEANVGRVTLYRAQIEQRGDSHTLIDFDGIGPVRVTLF